MNGIIIGTLTLAGSPMSVRVDRNSGLVWVAMDTNGTLIQSLGGFSTSNKWLAVMLAGALTRSRIVEMRNCGAATRQ